MLVLFLSVVPVVPVVVSISLLVGAVVIALILYYIRRRYKNRYHDYTPISKEAIKPEMLKALSRDIPVDMPDKIPPAEHSRSTPTSEDDSDEQVESIYPEGHIGRLWFTASYDSNTESLTVVLQKIENLPNRSGTVRSCDPCVKISLLPSNKNVAQSRYKRKNKNPVFNETFEIDLSALDLDETTLCLTVVDGYRANHQVTVGQVLYPLKHMHNRTEVQQDLIRNTEVSLTFF